MIYASTQSVDDRFIATIPAALRLLEPRAVNLVQGLVLMNSARFRKVGDDAAAAFVADYFRSEYADMKIKDKSFEADYVIELEPPANLTCMVRLVTPGRPEANAYGCSVRRIGEAAFAVDSHSPVFAAKWRWLFA